MGQVASPYEQQKPVKDLNKYATLKAVGKKLLTSRWTLMMRKLLAFIIWSD